MNQLVDHLNCISTWGHPELSKHIQSAVDRIRENGGIYRDIDGYYVWSPRPNQLYSRGVMTAIGALLKYKNVPWDIQIQTDPAIAGTVDAEEVKS